MLALMLMLLDYRVVVVSIAGTRVVVVSQV